MYGHLTRLTPRHRVPWRHGKAVEKRQVSRYTEAEIELGLRALAISGGNTRKASSLLARQGIKIPRTTLQFWAAEPYSERYRQIQDEVLPQIYAEIAQGTEDIARSATELEAKLIEKLQREYQDLDPDKAAAALQRVSTTKGINVDKSLLVRGRPTSIQATADITDLLKQAASLGPAVGVEPGVLDGEAPEVTTEETPAE
jgi:hypothetical protein